MSRRRKAQIGQSRCITKPKMAKGRQLLTGFPWMKPRRYVAHDTGGALGADSAAIILEQLRVHCASQVLCDTGTGTANGERSFLDALNRIVIVVGLQAEARLARPLGWKVAIGGGSAAGADAAARSAIAEGASALVSFGLAGGLDPALDSGALVVPHSVLTGGCRMPTDLVLSARLGGATGHCLLGAAEIVAQADGKRRLFAETGAAAVDLESGAVAQVATEHGLPFAVLRAVCDPAWSGLPPAALWALDAHGAIGVGRVLFSVLADLGQIPALLALARDAAAARRALQRRVEAIRTGRL